MKLQPVYLVAPEPKPPSISTRRAFLFAGSMFAAGTLVGGACGYTLGKVTGGGGVDSGKEPEPESTGDADLDELRRLAVEAPIDELVERAAVFLSYKVSTYRTDQVLWVGVDRLSKELIENRERRAPPSLYSAVIQTIEGGSPPHELALQSRVAALRARRDEEIGRK